VLLRSLLFNLAVYLNFLVQAVVFAPVLLMPKPIVWRVARFWVRSTLWLHRTIVGVGDEIRGAENIPAGGAIIASKHQSAWETLRLIELFPKPRFILKRELLWLPLFGWYLARAGMIPVDRKRGSAAIAAMTERARKAVAEGCQIIIFPEGTRRSPLAPPVYRFGVVRLYEALGVPCVPVALNSGLYWPRRALRHRRGTVLVAICAPIAPGLPAEPFAERLRATIESAYAGLLAEAFRDNADLEADARREAIENKTGLEA